MGLLKIKGSSHLICSCKTPSSHFVNCFGAQRFKLCFFLNHTTNSSLISIVRTLSSLFFSSTLSIVIWGVYFFVIIFGSAGGTRTRKPLWRQILSLLCIPIPPPRHSFLAVDLYLIINIRSSTCHTQ